MDCSAICQNWGPLADRCGSEWDSCSSCVTGQACAEKQAKCEGSLFAWESCVNSKCLEFSTDPACVALGY